MCVYTKAQHTNKASSGMMDVTLFVSVMMLARTSIAANRGKLWCF